ncbi:MAG: hypothetical protein ACP5H3_01730 [Candidatus Aenigmatarchaeota archaeon]
MFFKKKEDVSIEERLKEIEKKVKGLKESENLKEEKKEELREVKPIFEEKKKEENVEEKEQEAPLFVKLDKYKTIISSIMQLKALLLSLKNSLVALEQIEKTRTETFNLLVKNLEKMNERLSLLEKEVVKPVGVSFGSLPAYEEVHSVQTSIANLRAEIERLKAELETMQ